MVFSKSTWASQSPALYGKEEVGEERVGEEGDKVFGG